MDKIKKLMAEYSQLAGNNDEASVKRMEEIHAWIKNNATEEQKKFVADFVAKRVAKAKIELECLRAQMGEANYKLLPISYIAKEYFHKSAAWLLQRLNGYEVRGQVYSLNSEQKEIFNRAVKDISQQLANMKLA